MSVILAVLGLPLVLLLPGLCTLALWAPPRRFDRLEQAYLALAISLLASGWLGLLLGQLGWYSAGLLLGLLALYSLIVGLLAWRRNRWHWPAADRSPSPRWVLVSFVALSLLFGALFFRPFELILGPRDAAVYPATAAQIAQHGSVRIRDPLIPTLGQPDTAEGHQLWVNFFLVQSPGRFYYHYLRMPGFFIVEPAIEQEVAIPQGIPHAEEGVVVPQFYPLYPAWLAVAFSLLGFKAGLLMTPYLSFLGGIGAFLVARRLLGSPTALLAYLLLGLNTLQVWFARYSTAEGATQFLLFLCLFGLVQLEADESSRQSPFLGLLTGVALGLVGLVRVEFIFPWLLFLPYLVVLYVGRRFRRGHRFLLIGLGLLVLHTAVQFVTHTRGYTLGIYYHRIQDWYTLSWLVYPFLTPTLQEYFVNSETPRTLVLHQPWRLIWELGVPLSLAGLLVGLRRRPARVERLAAWLRGHRRLLLGGLAGLVLFGGVYAYLVRPGLLSLDVLLHPLENRLVLEGYVGAPVPAGRAANLVRLGWYLSPLGILLAFAGMAGLLHRQVDRRSWFLLLMGLFYTAVFTYEVFGMEHHVYIMRRYVAVVLPFFCIAMAYALTQLARARPLRRLALPAALLLAGAMVLYLAWTGLPFYRHTEYRGALDQIEALAGRFEPDDVLLWISDSRDAPFTVATPLQYLFERNALVIVADPPSGERIEEQIERWQAQGREVYLLVGNGGGRLFLPHTRLRWLDRFELAVPEFEQLTGQKPHNAYTLRLPFGIYSPERWSGAGSPMGDLPLTIDLGSAGYIYQAGGFHQDEVAPDGSTFCWTKGEGMLRLPWPEGSGTVTLTLRLAGGHRPAELGPARVDLLLEGEQLASWTLEEGFTTRSLALPADRLSSPETHTVLLSLVSPPWRQFDYGLGGDARPIGIQLDWVQLEAAGQR